MSNNDAVVLAGGTPLVLETTTAVNPSTAEPKLIVTHETNPTLPAPSEPSIAQPESLTCGQAAQVPAQDQTGAVLKP